MSRRSRVPDFRKQAQRALDRGDWLAAKDWIQSGRDFTPTTVDREASRMGRKQRATGVAAEDADIRTMQAVMERVKLKPDLVRSWRRKEAADIVTGADYQVDHPSFPLLVQRKHRVKVGLKQTWLELTSAWKSRSHYIRLAHITWTGEKPTADLVAMSVEWATILTKHQPGLFLWQIDTEHTYELEAVAARRLWERAMLASQERPGVVPSFLVRMADLDVCLCLYDWRAFVQDYEGALLLSTTLAG